VIAAVVPAVTISPMVEAEAAVPVLTVMTSVSAVVSLAVIVVAAAPAVNDAGEIVVVVVVPVVALADNGIPEARSFVAAVKVNDVPAVWVVGEGPVTVIDAELVS